MRKTLTTTAMLLLFTTIDAAAVEWTSIILKPEYEVLVDIDSYDVAEGYPYIITKTIFKREQIFVKNKLNIQYAYHVKNTQFNCKTPLFKVKSTDFYNSKGKVLASDKKPVAFKAISPSSDEFAVGQLVCQVHKMVGGQ
jgi:hypothetical protein